MRKAARVWLAAMALSLSLAACSTVATTSSMADSGRAVSGSVDAQLTSSSVSAPSAADGDELSESEATGAGAARSSATSRVPEASEVSQSPEPNSESATIGFSLDDIAPYSGKASVEVNGNAPFFTVGDLARDAFEEYSPLDALGRCGVAFALVGPETMPTEERGSIGMVKPSGWHTVRYDGLVDGNYLYNRCHLIGYQLTGENANERNLITGTRTMNVVGMLNWEDRVASYVERIGNHVLYRSTPVFEGDDLVARGVLLEAESVEDAGVGVRFCVWCYNVEPGVEIDYATGESRLAEGVEGTVEADAAEAAECSAPAAAPEVALEPPAPVAEAAPEPAPATETADVRTYVLNTNTHKFHYSDCSSVRDMAGQNKKIVDSTRDQIIADGYDPCKRCNP